ncbi:MAG: hypothetical protein H7Z10_10395 [Gemmatimonadaceae bacterium]|nr:hypothetical protein [Acetobacteraceae bacterium]
MFRRPLLLALAAATIARPAIAQTTPRRVRGTIDTLDGSTLVVTSREGEVLRIVLTPAYTVAAVLPTELSAVRPGAYIGMTAVGPKDKLRAAAVFVFPEAARGTAEGHGPWDLMPGSTMTNAAIEAEATGADGRDLTLLFKGERLVVTVPPGTPIVTSAPGTPALLTPGAKVLITTQQAADGSLSAARVNVGKDGFTPPM